MVKISCIFFHMTAERRSWKSAEAIDLPASSLWPGQFVGISMRLYQQIFKMSEQYVFWTQQEDEVLRLLREERQITKWSLISQIMKRQFGIRGRNGKKCRERYENHLNPSVKREEWTLEQEKRLMELHNLKGNKWVEISRELQRTDNSVKNHYHSKLRKAFRKINKCITDHLRHDFRPFKNNLLSKIIQASEEYYSKGEGVARERAEVALRLKNKILQHASLNQRQVFTQSQVQQIRSTARQIYEFNRHLLKSKSVGTMQKIPVCRYKGKEIINLLQENNAGQLDGQRGNPDEGEGILGQQGSQTPQESSIAQAGAIISPISEGRLDIGAHNMGGDIFNNVQGLHFFNSFYTYDFPYLRHEGQASIFSGKASSFTSYKPSSSSSISSTVGPNEAQVGEFLEKTGSISSQQCL